MFATQFSQGSAAMRVSSIASRAKAPQVEHFDVLIVGAGISGVGGAYHLASQCPGASFVVLESLASFRGTWLTPLPGYPLGQRSLHFRLSLQALDRSADRDRRDRGAGARCRLRGRHGIATFTDLFHSGHEPELPGRSPAQTRNQGRVDPRNRASPDSERPARIHPSCA